MKQEELSMASDSTEAGIPITGLLGSAEATPTVYANTVTMHWTLTDVSLRFGEVVQVLSGDEAKIREKVAVIIPWWQAKILRDALQDLVARYEKVNGELARLNLP
jgi:hypothetical protein